MNAEGYIKFDLYWTEGPPLPAEDLAETIRWRQKLHDLGYIGMYPDGIGFGNISCRWEDDRFAISGTATGGIAEIRPEHFCLVTGFDLARNRLECLGPVRASAESMTHGAVYRTSRTTASVIHIHNLSFWEKLLFKVPTTREEIAYGTPEMAGEIQRLFKEEGLEEYRILCMAGHREGIVSFGPTAESAGRNLLDWARSTGCLPGSVPT
jgi:L-ribulose-5-phosphate 4-epimerase